MKLRVCTEEEKKWLEENKARYFVYYKRKDMKQSYRTNEMYWSLEDAMADAKKGKYENCYIKAVNNKGKEIARYTI